MFGLCCGFSGSTNYNFHLFVLSLSLSSSTLPSPTLSLLLPLSPPSRLLQVCLSKEDVQRESTVTFSMCSGILEVLSLELTGICHLFPLHPLLLLVGEIQLLIGVLTDTVKRGKDQEAEIRREDVDQDRGVEVSLQGSEGGPDIVQDREAGHDRFQERGGNQGHGDQRESVGRGKDRGTVGHFLAQGRLAV